ncbi:MULTISPECIES: GTP 3',8-cyclase MoaA [unclassified Luteococcus]|uniref:GTP 3',8-cyclase MoaA n=1 Tax=unclassified Luteococcus TaxID=2639923 RepID=UPI00313AA791
MTSGQLVDRFGRRASDLRLSVTDVCNLRCTYCLPASGVTWLPRATILEGDELARLAHIGISQLGITKIRLTGGEPLTRPDLNGIVAAIHGQHPAVEIALTTNGVGLAERADDLARAGLTRVNVSLDTVHEDTFRRLTRRDGLSRVLAGIRASVAAGLGPVKINSVLLQDVNDGELLDLLGYCLAEGAELRIIEQMPIGATRDWARENLISAADIRGRIEQRYQLRSLPGRGPAPAERWEVLDAGRVLGTVGIVASVTEPFCAACDRTRISADGQLRSCLFSQTETDLRTPLRAGASDEELAGLWADAMWAKPRAHGSDAGGFGTHFIQPARPMNAIGG